MLHLLRNVIFQQDPPRSCTALRDITQFLLLQVHEYEQREMTSRIERQASYALPYTKRSSESSRPEYIAVCTAFSIFPCVRVEVIEQSIEALITECIRR